MRSRLACWGAAIVVVAVALCAPRAATAAVTEPNGLSVPAPSSTPGETSLDTYFTGLGEAPAFAQNAAQTAPGTFFPLAGSSITVVLHEAGEQAVLVWYNVTGSAPAAADLHVIVNNAVVGTTVLGSTIRDSPMWAGGRIAFAIRRPVSTAQLHYSENQWNVVCTFCSPPAPWILGLQYRSTTVPNSAYIAFEDGFVTQFGFNNDGDFNDVVFLLNGLLPQCGDAADNDGDGAADAADRGCYSATGGAYDATDDDESDDPPLPRVTVGPLAANADILTAAVTQPGTGVRACQLAIDTAHDGSFQTALPTTVAGSVCTAVRPVALAPGDYAVRATYTDTFGTVVTDVATLHIDAPDAALPSPSPLAAVAAGSAAPVPLTLRCTGKTIQLIRVDRRSGKVRVAGLALPRLAGRRVTIKMRTVRTGFVRTVGTAAVRSDGGFSTLVRGPRRRSARVVYTGSVAGHVSSHLHLQRRLHVIGQQGRTVSIRIALRVVKGMKLRIKRRISCKAYRIVATRKLGSSNRVTLTLPPPGAAGLTIYRVLTVPPPGSRGRSYTLPIVVHR